MRKPENVLDAGFNNPEYEKILADIKRVLEKWSLDRDFQIMYEDDPEKALAETGLQTDPETIALLLNPQRAEALAQSNEEGSFFPEELPESYVLYKEFVSEKLKKREEMRTSLCIPTEPRFKSWRERQRKRLLLELGEASLGMVHAPVIYELSEGCSVGCPFCGVAAKGLKGVFRYTPENGKLWQETLKRMHFLVGDAAGKGTCYYACEGLDNPDYERFLEDFYQEYGVIPQTTTAASTRDIERTRALLQYGKERFRHIDRFSVLSPLMRDRLFEEFKPEELLLVELLPQFPEAPQCHLTKTGRNRTKEEEDETGGTIACASGFIINMQERSVRMVTPCATDREHPTGERFFEKCTFRTAEELESIIRRMIGKYMAERLDLRCVYGTVCDFTLEKKEGKVRVKAHGTDAALLDSDLSQETLDRLLIFLKKRSITCYEILESLLKEKETDIAQVIFLFKTLWNYGIIDTAAVKDQTDYESSNYYAQADASGCDE